MQRASRVQPFGEGVPAVTLRPAGGGLDPWHGRRVNFNGKAYGWEDFGLTRLTYELGGAAKVTRPFEENWVVYACLRGKSRLAQQVQFVLWQSDEPDAEAVSPTDPLAVLFDLPNPIMSWGTLIEATITHLDLVGECFWFLFQTDASSGPVADGQTVPGMIWPVAGNAVEPVRTGDRTTGWKFSGGGKTYEFPTSAVIHFRYFDPAEPTRGIGPIEALSRVLGLQFNAERYMDGLLRNNGSPSGIIYAKSALTQQQVEDAQRSADVTVNDPANAGKWKVVGGSETEFKELGYKPNDMEHAATHDHVRHAICAVTGWNELLLGFNADSATFANKDASLREVWQHTIVPLLDYVADTITRYFLRPRAWKWVAGFDYSTVEALKTDNTDRLLKVAQIVATGIGLSFNEVAAMCGLEVEPPESGDVRYTSPTLSGQEPGVEQTPAILNGAQLAQAVEIVSNVAAGVIPRDSGLGMLGALFGLTPEQAHQIMGTAGTGAPTDPNVPQGLPEPAPQNGAARAQQDDDSTPLPNKGSKRGSPLLSKAAPARDRRAYWKSFSARVLFPSQKQIELAARRFLSKYAAAQRARVRDFAENGYAAKGFSKDIAADLTALLLNEKEWAEKFEKIIRPALTKAWSLALADAADDVGDFQLGPSDERILRRIDAQLIKLTEGVNGTLTEKVRGALERTLSEASNIADLQSAVRELLPEIEGTLEQVFGTNDARALAIARTESSHAANTARMEQYAEAGIDEIEWIHAGPVTEDSREDHVALDGQRIKIGGTFSNGLAYPHDPNAPADEVVNCACISAAVIE